MFGHEKAAEQACDVIGCSHIDRVSITPLTKQSYVFNAEDFGVRIGFNARIKG